MANVGVLFMLFSVGNKVPKVDKILCPTPRGRLQYSREFVVHGVVVFYLISFIQFSTECRLACNSIFFFSLNNYYQSERKIYICTVRVSNRHDVRHCVAYRIHDLSLSC